MSHHGVIMFLGGCHRQGGKMSDDYFSDLGFIHMMDEVERAQRNEPGSDADDDMPADDEDRED